MPSTKDIGGLHATLTANASQYVAEFKKADAATQMHARGMMTATDQLMHDVERSFTGAKFAKGLLEGLGIGTAVTAVTRVADLFIGMWKESEEYAKQLEGRAENIANIMRGLSRSKFDLGIELKETDVGKRTAVRSEIDRLKSVMAELELKRESAAAGMAAASLLGRGEGLVGTYAGVDFTQYGRGHSVIGGTPAKEAGDALQAAMDDAQKHWAELNKELLDRLKQERELTEKVKQSQTEAFLVDKNPLINLANLRQMVPKLSKEEESAAHQARKRFDFAPDAPLSNAFRRLGLLGGVGSSAGAEQNKQVNLLTEIRDAIRRLMPSTFATYNGAGYYT